MQFYWDVEIGIPLRALRFAASGFRVQRAAGFSYDRDGMLSVVLIALAVTTIPEAFVFDLLFSHMIVARVISSVLHGYAIIWMLAIAQAAQTQMHAVDDKTVTLRCPLGRSIVLCKDQIAAVRVVDRRPHNALRFGLGHQGVLIELEEPVRFDTDVFPRTVKRLFAGADRAIELARQLRKI